MKHNIFFIRYCPDVVEHIAGKIKTIGSSASFNNKLTSELYSELSNNQMEVIVSCQNQIKKNWFSLKHEKSVMN